MDSKIILESFLTAIDIGMVFESINNYRKRGWQVDLGEIIKYMIIGKGYTNLTPPQTSRLLLENEDNVRIVDLRETETYEKNHINGSISKPIDDFLKEHRVKIESLDIVAVTAAAKSWMKYLKRKEKVKCPQCGYQLIHRAHFLSDFFIGGFASAKCDAIITRDRGIYKKYFPNLVGYENCLS